MFVPPASIAWSGLYGLGAWVVEEHVHVLLPHCGRNASCLCLPQETQTVGPGNAAVQMTILVERDRCHYGLRIMTRTKAALVVVDQLVKGAWSDRRSQLHFNRGAIVPVRSAGIISLMRWHSAFWILLLGEVEMVSAKYWSGWEQHIFCNSIDLSSRNCSSS